MNIEQETNIRMEENELNLGLKAVRRLAIRALNNIWKVPNALMSRL